MGDQRGKTNKSSFTFPEKTKLYSGGIDSTFNNELSGNFNDGKSVENRNCRPTSDEGNYGAQEEIRGAVLRYKFTDKESYYCLCSVDIRKRIVSLWADKEEALAPFIAVDGAIVLESDKFTIDHKYHIDYDKNENIAEGEFFITDYNSTPMYFNVGDLLQNLDSGSQKYFSNFNQKLYEINLEFPFNVLVLKDLVNVGSGGGLPVGQHSYMYRMSSNLGDKTSWSIATPNIFVPQRYIEGSELEEVYPYIGTTGADPNPEVSSPFAIALKLRISNIYNYDYIELARTSYASGEGIGFRPQSKIVQRISISPGQFSVMEIVDSITNQTDSIPISDEQQQNVLSIIKRAKTIRYFKNKITLANIEYEKREVGDSVEFKESVNGNIMAPIVKSIGTKGYNDVVNHTYNRSYQHNERYGYAILFWDENFQRTFVKKIDGFENFQMPSKRDELTGDSLAHSDIFPLQCTDKNSVDGNFVPTFEVVHHGFNLGGGGIFGVEKETGDLENVLVNIGDVEETNGAISEITARDAGYNPRYPISSSDSRNRRNYTPTATVVASQNGAEVDLDLNVSTLYFALGMKFFGLNSFPGWAKAFSVVRTRRANRVIAQGFASYLIRDGEFTAPAPIRYITGVTKDLNRISCHFPDFENGVVSPNTIDDIINNPESYKIQLAEPLGIKSELYHSAHHIYDYSQAVAQPDTQVDLVTYANVQRSPNPRGVAGNFGVNDNVGYGKYLNDTAPPIFPGGGNGNQLIGILAVNQNTENEEGEYHLEFELDRDIYLNSGAGTAITDKYADEGAAQNFLEPFYIVNIIKEEASVPDRSFSKYLINGTYIKIESIVGYGTGEQEQEFEIVDERVDDFHRSSASDIYDNYVFIRNSEGEEIRYINVNYFTPVEYNTVLLDIQNETQNFIGVPLGGVYTSTETSIKFILSQSLNVPLQGEIILVKYNNLRPVEVFNGDTFVGGAMFPFVHRKCAQYGQKEYGKVEKDGKNGLMLGTAFPQYMYVLNQNIYKLNMEGIGGKIMHIRHSKLDVIRQLVYIYSVQTRSHLPLSYGNFFPLVNYIERPISWATSYLPDNIGDDVFPEYFDDYPDEYLRWQLGGIQIEQYKMSLDFMKEAMHQLAYSRSEISFEEANLYKDRIHWSETRPINVSASSNLKSFKPFSYKDIGDEHGEINKLFSANAQSGDNLYAFCEEDIALLLVKKSTISDAGGDLLGQTDDSDASFITQEVWLGTDKDSVLEEDFRLSFKENGDEAFFCNREGVYKFVGNTLTPIDTGYKNILYGEFLKDIFFQYEGKEVAANYDSRYNEYWLQYREVDIVLDLYRVYGEAPLTIGEPRYTETLDFTEFSSGKILLYSSESQNSAIEEYASHPDMVLQPSIAGFEFKSSKSGEWILCKSGGLFNFIHIVHNNLLVHSMEGLSVAAKLVYDAELDSLSVEVFDVEDIVRFEKLYVYCNVASISNWLGYYDYSFDRYLSFDKRTYGFKDGEVYELHSGNKISGENINFEILDSFNPEDIHIHKDKEFRKIQINTNKISPDKIEFSLDDKKDVLCSLLAAQLKRYGGFQSLIPRDETSRKRIQGISLSFKVTYSGEERMVVKSTTLQYRIIN